MFCLQVEYKSQPIPEEPEDGGVTIVVGKTVDSILFDESKDVLLEVYAPWCGHCKQLEPTYKKLAKRFKKVSSCNRTHASSAACCQAFGRVLECIAFSSALNLSLH